MRASPNRTKFRPLSMIKQRVVPAGQRRVTIPFGVFRGLVFNIDFRSQTQFYLGLWEFETHPCIRHGLESARWMIDAGAGHGELCILFRRHGCQAFAIEPDTTALSVLHANMPLNGLSRSDIAVLPKYVGTSIDQDHIGLDRVEVDRSKPGFIKIDIEGFETDALESANSLLDESDVTLLIEVHSKELEAGCIGILSSHGYTCRIIDNSRWRALIPERRLVSHNRWIWAERDLNSLPVRG